MILLADGGSTKVDWSLIDGDKEMLRIATKGANPFFRTTEDISAELKEHLVPHLKGYKIQSVYFYGAGCAFPEKNEIIRKAIAEHIPNANIEVDSDLVAAAKGLCGHSKGIACIIGTGSNSCYYDGNKIADNVSPLGYVLGDEGSGAVLGKLFVGACLKNQLTKGIKEKMMEEMKVNQQIILEKVYRQPLANRFLASFCPFILKNIEDKTVRQVVHGAFREFFIRNVMQYDYQNNAVAITGSVAFHFQDILKEVAKELNITISQITDSPMEGLKKYYQ